MAPLSEVNTTMLSFPSLGSLGSTNSSDHTMPSQVQTVVIPLDPDVLSSLCRRGRRHLREIQTSCQVMLQLDRVRGQLHVVGVQEAIKNVQRRLESLGGPIKSVSVAVWTELMRTRTTQDGPEAYLTQIQESSCCRIHIERHKQEVRLFGPRDAVSLADKLLDEFSRCVVESIIRVGNSIPSRSVLENVAFDKHVTLRQDGNLIIITGMHQHVQEAEAEITNHINAHAAATSQCSSTPAPRMPELSVNQLIGHASSLSKTGMVQGAQTWTYPTSTPTPAASQENSVGQHRVPPPTPVPSQEDSHHLCQVCPTCAAVRACASCGNWCGWHADHAGISTGVQHTVDANTPTYQYVQLIPYEAVTAGSGYTNMPLVPAIMQPPGPMVPEGMSTQIVVQAPYMHTGKVPAYFMPVAGNNHEFCGDANP